MVLKKNQQVVYEIIKDHQPISKRDITTFVNQKGVKIYSIKTVLDSLRDKKHAIILNENNTYSINPSFNFDSSTNGGSKKVRKIKYSGMISSNNKGRFKKLKEKLKLEVEEDYLVLLNNNNSKKIEKFLDDDLSYVKYTEMFCEKSGLKTDLDKRYDIKTITGVVRIIDIENGTQQWLNSKGRDRSSRMIAYIVKRSNKFWDDLNAGKPELIDNLIKAAVKDEGKNTKGKDFDGPKSLASKICKYLSLYVLEKDSYYVNDSFVRRVLPYYFRYYLNNKRITGLSSMSYADLHKLFVELHTCPEIEKENLTKHKIDHIMWYSYKNSRGTFINKSKTIDGLFYYL